MSNYVLVYKTGARVYYVDSAFTHQRIGQRMSATWAKGLKIKKLIWLAIILAAFLVFLFPKVAAQTWFNNQEPSRNQNSANLSADQKTVDPSTPSTGIKTSKGSGSTLRKNQIQTPPADIKSYTKDEVQKLIIDYAAQFGIDPTVPLKIAYCESGFRWDAKNSTSTASGVFQFIRSTWLGTPEGRSGLSPFDADANIKAAIRKISEGGISAWNASKSCWNK